MQRASWALAALIALGVSVALSSARAQEPVTSLRYGRWGFDATGVDPQTKPGDDFFKHVNGAWLARTEMPPDKARIMLRGLMTDATEARLRALLEDAARRAGHEPAGVEGKVGAFYKAFMDEARVEALGARPLEPALAAIRAATTREQLGAVMGRASFDLGRSFFRPGIYVDPKDPTRYAVSLRQGGLGLPDRGNYLGLDPATQEVRSKYQAHAERLLTLIGWPDPVGSAAQVVALETRIAEASWTRAEARELDATYNPLTIAELEALVPAFPWRPFLARAKLGSVDRVIAAERSAFPRIAGVFADAPVATLQAWLALTVADDAAPYLSKPFADASFDMRKRTLSGQQEQEARWKRGVRAVSGDLDGNGGPFDNIGWAVGQLYVERHFPPTLKAQVETLAADLIRAFRTRVERLDWMSATTKAEALRKLDTYNVKVGYPDKPRDYTSLVIRDDDLVGNVRRAAEVDWDFHVNRLSEPVDRDDWRMTPQSNNAYNGGRLRDIVFPAALLQAPMFDPGADSAINYGAIGAYIGHEITHGFDDQGRKIDAEGRLRDWWTREDAEIFATRAAELGRQYSAFEPLPGVRVNGRLTMGENIADLGGLAVALDAYRASLHGEPAPVIEGLTGDQRVFLGWAQAWRGKVTDEFLRNQVRTDPHAPRQYRVNGVVRNIDDWYAAFDVRPGDELYLAPDKRVRIW